MSPLDNELPSWLGAEYYPRWLRDGLLSNQFPWSEAKRTTMREFLERYTLHDSILRGLWQPSGGPSLVVIHWELAGNSQIDVSPEPEEVQDESARFAVPFWPVLLIGFDHLLLVSQERVVDPTGIFITEVTTGPLPTDMLTRLLGADIIGRDLDLDPPDLQDTWLYGPSGAFLRLIHRANVQVLPLTRTGNRLDTLWL